MKITIIEPICYLFPHKDNLVASHPTMKGVWITAQNLVNRTKDSMFAPLLIDDIPTRMGVIVKQDIEDFTKLIGKTFEEINWLGSPISEYELLKKTKIEECSFLDTLYHQEVIKSLNLLGEWKWISINPIFFKKEQADMLEELWNQESSSINFGAMANRFAKNKVELKTEIRNNFLSKFEHYWIDNEGKLESITQPKYNQGRIINEKIA